MNSSFKKLNILFGIALFSFVVVNTATAQCKTAIKDGITKLAPYPHNGEVNNVNLEKGKPAEIHLSFYKGASYKIQLCSEEALGKVNFRVFDENNTEIFNSSTANSADSWVFFSNSSQELVVEISSADKTKNGCAAVVVGMQVPKAARSSMRNL